MNINAEGLNFKELNDIIRENDGEIVIDRCCGQRFIASGQSGRRVCINGVPGNALGSYLNGAEITVRANAQDAVGDTMNDGKIVIHGDVGDALGYAMRGGKIFVKGSSGYRTGIHMKEYGDKKPVIIVGGGAGSFLGEYLAGGVIIVLGIGKEAPFIGNFPGTGMHGGKIFIRSDALPEGMPAQVMVEEATREELAEIKDDLTDYCSEFGYDAEAILSSRFYVLKPNAKNPYKRLYTEN